MRVLSCRVGQVRFGVQGTFRRHGSGHRLMLGSPGKQAEFLAGGCCGLKVRMSESRGP